MTTLMLIHTLREAWTLARESQDEAALERVADLTGRAGAAAPQERDAYLTEACRLLDLLGRPAATA